MKTTDQKRIKELIDRIGRISAADEWTEDINPTQWSALSYLARANRFSRSPSQVTDFMSTTRGTVSQTLKALARKGLIEVIHSKQDKRSISYAVTAKGEMLFQRKNIIETALSHLSDDEGSNLLKGLETLVRNSLILRNLRAFGICKTCVHHVSREQGGYCNLLGETLLENEINQICHEHSEVA